MYKIGIRVTCCISDNTLIFFSFLILPPIQVHVLYSVEQFRMSQNVQHKGTPKVFPSNKKQKTTFLKYAKSQGNH